MPKSKQITIFLVIYFLIRIFSYYFGPDTPLFAANPINSIAAIFILATAVYFLFKKPEIGWLIIAGEILLGGGGNFFAVHGVSLRVLLLVASLSIYSLQKIQSKKVKTSLEENKKIVFLFLLLMLSACVSAARGYFLGNDIPLIISDLIPYLFLLYYFPLRELWNSQKFKNTAMNALYAAIIGNAVFALFTFFGFGGGLFALQDSYYHWFRDVAGGKITDLGLNFYRIILNEQLLLTPTLLLFLHKIIKKQYDDKKIVFFSVFSLLSILSINLTRVYVLALFIGLLFLFNKQNWKRWLAVSVAVFFSFFLIFTFLHSVASRGQSLGLELFGLRLQSIAAPRVEESSMSRMLLLGPILEKIKARPIFGSGLGDTVTAYSPVFKKEITTQHFDWGYLEIIAEMGAVGFAIWILFIIFIFNAVNHYPYSKRFFISALAAMLVINITSPALFHIFGIVFLTIVASSTQTKKAEVFSA
ncbi:MAG: O-antigen ligase family protein [Patescibacteria group bacterium]|nr:O-antigen ligase family protein [Patescibacteria group bacterium]